MRTPLDRIVVNDFKRIESLEVSLRPITSLVSGKTSGKSSALQAAQLGVSILQAAFRGRRGDDSPMFAGTVSNDAVLFQPTEQLFDRRRDEAATENFGDSVTYADIDLDTNAAKSLKSRSGGASSWSEPL